jgi:murE/murF fusion protein
MSHPSSLSDLIIKLRQVAGSTAALCLDSRQVRPGDVFLACPGLSTDGRMFISQALAQGACAVVCQAPLTQAQAQDLGQVPCFEVQDLRASLGALADAWWGHPSQALTVIAITGTNGKTTTAQWLGSALRFGGFSCGVIGTLGLTSAHGEQQSGVLTTPDVVNLHRMLAQLRDSGATHVVMEASSIGLHQQRLDAVEIDVAVFTNLTQDHLDYHSDMATYAAAKALLFSRPEVRHAIVNVDDPWADLMIANSRAPVKTFSVTSDKGEVRGTNVVVKRDGMQFDWVSGSTAMSITTPITTPFIGEHNVSNMLAIAAVLEVLNWTQESIAHALRLLPAVPGRLEPVSAIEPSENNLRVFVDYAHTPDALERALKALQPLAQARAGKLWCVVGCGGNRDVGKRPLMARVACENADLVMLTSDNPRDEDPDLILQHMRQGVPEVASLHVERDRALAILSVIWRANPRDVIVLAGKGHETYQEVRGKRHAFDDRQWARLALTLASGQTPVQTDTRQLSAGALFVALRGERFDGHDYLAQAAKAGAIAAIVESAVTTATDQPLAQIALGDTQLALQKIARAWRARFDIPVIGVAGSNGKTTTKEMIAAMLRAWVGDTATLATQGNLNNEIGVPLTVLKLRQQHRAAVIEMGMNHPGEMAVLSGIAQPTIGLVLNAQREHQEFMQSVDAVALENGEVLKHLPNHGTAVYPAAETYSALWQGLGKSAANHVTFGIDRQADVMACDIKMDALGSTFQIKVSGQSLPLGLPVSLPISGQHNVMNATAAVACAMAAGAPLEATVQALEGFNAVKGRMQAHRLGSGQLLIDDTYNANPDSVRAAIDVLASMPAPRALVLGDMGEVGDQGPQMHAEVGQYARECAIDYLWTLGRATEASVKAFGVNARAFDDLTALCHVARAVQPASLLIKGSRFMAMERVVNELLMTNDNKKLQETSHAS